ncbi:hypothetical protein [Moorena producens]|uniref:hypothetical protein n=1 Tax=Moorena producens TaxID=1155739 RepID=UPI003C784BC0
MIVKVVYQKALNAKQKIQKNILYLSGAKTVHCIGDSHLNLFYSLANKHLWMNTNFEFCQVNGATAMGLANPNSQTNALPKFREYIASVPYRDTLLLSLGEVDCGFVIYYRAKKYGTPISCQFERSLKHYFDFLQSLSSLNFKNIIVPSVPLPTIADNQDWGEVANLRKSINVPLRKRTDITTMYNAEIKKFCGSNKIIYLDYESEIIDQNTRLIRSEYMNYNPLDHHLNGDKVSNILRIKFKEIGFW